NKYFDGTIMSNAVSGEFDDDIKALALKTVSDVDRCITEYKISDALECILVLARRLNKYIDETMPWSLAKDDMMKDRLGAVLYNLLEGIRFISVLLSPFMPDTSKIIFEQLNTEVTDYNSLKDFGGLVVGSKVGTPTPLFNRIDSEKLIAELSANKAEAKSEENSDVPPIVSLSKIGIEDFNKVELRVAEIKACEKVKKAKKLLKLTLDDGTGTDRIVASGIAKWYEPDSLIGKKIVLVANLNPAVLCSVESNGMILAADCGEDDVKVVFVEGMPNGARIR
ncbi:MAG: methionine--tRNA ligase subunit beta, partial [Oscillospiraceae bacterium]